MANIDFLKSCRTNVRMVEDVFKMRYSVWQLREPTSPANAVQSTLNTVHSAVRALRDENILCTTTTNDDVDVDGEGEEWQGKEELWIFGSTPEEAEPIEILDKQ